MGSRACFRAAIRSAVVAIGFVVSRVLAELAASAQSRDIGELKSEHEDVAFRLPVELRRAERSAA